MTWLTSKTFAEFPTIVLRNFRRIQFSGTQFIRREGLPALMNDAATADRRLFRFWAESFSRYTALCAGSHWPSIQTTPLVCCFVAIAVGRGIQAANAAKRLKSAVTGNVEQDEARL